MLSNFNRNASAGWRILHGTGGGGGGGGTTSKWLTRSNTTLSLNGTTWRGAGFDWHWAALRETNLQYPTHAMIDQVLDEAVSMGATVIRAHTLGISAGLSQQLVTAINADGSLVWNNAAWEPIDYVIAGAKSRGIRLWIPYTDQYYYYHLGKGWWVQQAFVHQSSSSIPSSYTYSGTTETGVSSFDPTNGNPGSSQRYKIIAQQFYSNTWIKNAFINEYIVGWLSHINQYTSVAHKDEPMVAFAQAGNELWDSGGSYISGNTSSAVTNLSGSYTELTMTATAPSNAAYAVPQIEFDGPASGTVVVRVDQWGVFAGNSASPWSSP